MKRICPPDFALTKIMCDSVDLEIFAAEPLRSWLASSPAETFDPSTVETPPSGLRVITRGPGPSTPDGGRAEPVNVVGLSASAQEPWRPNGSNWLALGLHNPGRIETALDVQRDLCNKSIRWRSKRTREDLRIL